MCGIAGVLLRDPRLNVDLDAMLDTLLAAIDHRGGDATGYVAVGNDGEFEWQKAACDAKDFSTYRRRVPRGTSVILAHTRWATQGLPAFMENNHPLRRATFFAVHNGHVMNDSKLLTKSAKRPHGQVDSEAIVALLARSGSLDQLGDVMGKIEGMAAVAAIDSRRGDRLSLSRGCSSPLYVLETRKIVVFASTLAAVLGAYRTHVGSIDVSRVRELAEGTTLHYEDGKKTEETFTAYQFPVVHKPWTPPTQTSRERREEWSDETEDYADCDDCGTWVPYSRASYSQDEMGLTLVRCQDCANESAHDLDYVNRFVLESFEAKTVCPG